MITTSNDKKIIRCFSMRDGNFYYSIIYLENALCQCVIMYFNSQLHRANCALVACVFF